MKKYFYSVVKEKLGDDIFKGAGVVDVGCMRFEQSIALRDMGADVIALDIRDREDVPEGIQFVHTDFLEWEPEKKTDILHMSNSALFMPTEKVFQKIEALDPRIIAVRTMYDYPEPNWNAEELQQLYFTTPEEWTSRFEPLGFKTMHSEKYEVDTPDLQGHMRTFRSTEYIGAKKE